MYKLSALLFLCLSFSSCAFVVHRRGLGLQNPEHIHDPHRMMSTEYHITYDLKREILLKPPHFYFSLKEPVDENVLFWGPGFLVPLPIIPWVPGMVWSAYRSFRERKNEEKVQVSVVIDGRWRSDLPVNYEFNFSNTRLIVDNNHFQPINVSCKFSSGSTAEFVVTDCEQTEAGHYQVRISSSGMGFWHATFDLTFEILYSQIDRAEIDFGDVFVNGNSISTKITSIRRKRGIMMLWLWGINN